MGERPPVLPISRITLGTSRWRAKVVVVDKTDAQTSQRGHKTQKILLQDDQGTVIEAILWNNIIGLFEHTLEISKTYIVGEITIQPIRDGYRYMSPKIDVEWVLRANSVIRAVTEDTEMISYPLLHSMPHREIVAVAGTKTPVDVMVAVVGVSTTRDVTMNHKSVPMQELTVVDQSLNQFTLSLWGDYVHQKGTMIRARIDEMPVLMCRRLLSRAYSGGSLSTVPYSYILIAPDLPQAQDMKQWVHTNLSAIKQIGKPAPLQEKGQSSGKEKVGEASMQLSTTITAKEVHGIMSILDITQDVAYCTCRSCFEVTLEYKEERFICNKCHKNETAQPRCRLVVLLEDHDSMMTATLFDDNVEELLKHKVDELHCIDADRTQLLLEKARDVLSNKKIIAKVVPHTLKCSDPRTIQTIQDWRYVGEVTETEPPLQAKTPSLEATPDKKEGKRNVARAEAEDDEQEAQQKKKKVGIAENDEVTETEPPLQAKNPTLEATPDKKEGKRNAARTEADNDEHKAQQKKKKVDAAEKIPEKK